MSPNDALREVLAAAPRLTSLLPETPVRQSMALSRSSGCEAWLKLENLQVTGSFKIRGAFNKLLSLPQPRPPVVAASTGNHALAMAHASRSLGCACTLVMPSSASPYKIAALRKYDVQLRLLPADEVAAETEARQTATAQGHVFVSPYNDPAVIGGQGTTGLELIRQVPNLDAILVSVGGGGLISGIAAICKAVSPRTRIVGCSPSASPVMHESINAGRIIARSTQPTLSDGTAGGIEPGAITYPLCQSLVDEWLLVSEEQIARAIKLLFDEEALTVEGAAGVAAGALLSYPERFSQKRVAVVLCGGNVRPT